MSKAVNQRFGAVSIVAGSLLLGTYAALFPIILPISGGSFDYTRLVLSSGWVPLALAAFFGVIFMLIGLDTVYSRLESTSGFAGTAGLILLKAAFVLQACKISWELLLDPVIAGHPQASFLLRDAIIFNDPAVAVFRIVSTGAIVAGIALFGTALYRSRQFPRKATILVATGTLVYAAGSFGSVVLAIVGIVTLSIGCGLIGRVLWAHTE